MSDREPVDTAAPWTIKAIGTGTREAVIKAARQEGLTVGQWLERRVAEWLADGSPVPVGTAPPGPAANLGDLAQLVQAATAAAAAAAVPVPPAFARAAMQAARQAMRQARPAPAARPVQARLAAPAGSQDTSQ